MWGGGCNIKTKVFQIKTELRFLTASFANRQTPGPPDWSEQMMTVQIWPSQTLISSIFLCLLLRDREWATPAFTSAQIHADNFNLHSNEHFPFLPPSPMSSCLDSGCACAPPRPLADVLIATVPVPPSPLSNIYRTFRSLLRSVGHVVAICAKYLHVNDKTSWQVLWRVCAGSAKLPVPARFICSAFFESGK